MLTLNRSYRSLFCLLLIVVSLLLNSCSNKKNTWRHRGYHNLTAHYNGYFNARETFKEGVAKIENTHEDDYTKILPIFIYGDESASKTIYPQMDKAIEKCEKTIQRHSIYINREEFINWIDDCYFLIGKCHFYKQNYLSATESFEYVAKAFKEEEIGKEALLWLARTYLEKQDLDEASKVLYLMEQNPEFPKKFRSDLAALSADFYVRQNNYTLAIPDIKTSIVHTKKKKRRTRLMYILAQLYHQEENYEQASFYYSQVAKMNPPYEMEFYAKINRALAYNVGTGNSEEIIKQLKKMLRDDKNKEFKDQIYYALAELAIKEGDLGQGIEYFKLSASSSISNNNQKGLAFLKLADIYFEMPSYPLAQAYYDSTVSFIDKNRLDFQTILNKRNSLTRLVRDITIVEREDSLQLLASMTDKEREDIIEDIIQKVIDEEERKKELMEQGNEVLFNMNASGNNQDQGSGANWYFYNPSTLSFGFSEFKRLWGDRKLEDNWRRKNKASTFMIDTGEPDFLEGTASSDTSEGTSNIKSKEYYLNNIPLSEEKMKRSDGLIIEALYDLGLVYKEQLDDNFLAIESFENLLSRYDTCKYKLSTYYQLYRLHTTEGNVTEAAKYRNIILTEYPDSEYAQILKNPEYFKQKEAEKSSVIDFYKKTYDAYAGENYHGAIALCAQADSLYPENELAPKFDLIKALSRGKTTNRDTLILELKIVVAKHPKTEEAKEAQRMVDILIKNKQAANKGVPKVLNYQYKAEILHSCILIVPNKGHNINDIKTTISKYNAEFFRLAGLQIKSVFLDKDRQLISIKKFDNKAKAMDYYKAFSENQDALKDINNNGFSFFAISNDNYALLYNKKDIEAYLSFFDKNYQPD